MEKIIESATDKVSLTRVDEEIWMEFHKSGLRLRFELDQGGIDNLARISKILAEELREHTKYLNNAIKENTV